MPRHKLESTSRTRIAMNIHFCFAHNCNPCLQTINTAIEEDEEMHSFRGRFATVLLSGHGTTGPRTSRSSSGSSGGSVKK
mmetsp:Transcript_851/g.1907  ORF Transcript_851/g.1907 Transcript_851/m.1907 type:complete len:80 (+) Transcript_851:842-1081(+)